MEHESVKQPGESRECCGKCLRLEIPKSADGMKLETYLRQQMQFTKAQTRSMKFRENGLRLNGERVRVTQLLRTGDALEIGLEEPDTDSGHLESEQKPIRILYEDEDLLAVWKESGLVLHPSHGHYQDTLSNRVHAYFQQKGEHVRIRSIGRLDRDTSGIVVFAKNQIAAARLWKQKEEGIFWKEYQAVCEGVFAESEGTIDTPIAPLAGEKMKMCVSSDGSPSVTHYRVIRREQDRTHLLVRIETGRTHQIRVHMVSIGHPIVGDVLYGTEDVQGLQLCAWKAELFQPFSGKRIVLKAESGGRTPSTLADRPV